MTTPSGHRLSFGLPAHKTSDLAGAVISLASACILGWLVALPSNLHYLALLPLAFLLVSAVVFIPYSALIITLCLGIFAPAYLVLPIEGVPGSVTPTLLAAMTIALCGLRIAVLSGLGLRQPRALGAVLAFCAVWYLCAVFARTSGGDIRGLDALFQSPVPPLALVGGFLASSTPQGRRSLVLGLTASSTLAAALAVVEFLTRQNVFHAFARGQGVIVRGGPDASASGSALRFGLIRAEGAFSHPIMLGAFLVIGLLATLAWRSLQARPSRLISIAIGVQLLGLVLTVSRGPIVTGLVFMLLWFVLEARERAGLRVAIPLVAGMLCLVALSNSGITDGVRAFFGFGSPADRLTLNLQYRFDLLGVLLGNWQHANAFGYVDAFASDVFGGRVSLDNHVAYVLATQGLAGALAWLGLVIAPVVIAAKRHLNGLPGRRFVVLAPLAILMLSMGVGFFDLFSVYLYVVLGMCWGSIAGGKPAPAAT